MPSKLPPRRADETPLQELVKPTSPQADMSTGKQADLITFSARGVDREIARRIRIHAATTEQNIGVIVTAALREYMARHGEG